MWKLILKNLKLFKKHCQSKDPRIGFAHCTINSHSSTSTATKYGDFMVGSPLSYQLAIFDTDFEIASHLLFNNTNVGTIKNELLDVNQLLKYQ